MLINRMKDLAFVLYIENMFILSHLVTLPFVHILYNSLPKRKVERKGKRGKSQERQRPQL